MSSEEQKKVCVITGGSGLVGQALIRVLLDCKDYDEIRSLDIHPLPQPVLDLASESSVRLVHAVADITEEASLEPHFVGCDTVFHVAAMVSWSLNDKPAVEKVNVGGTQTVLNLACAHMVRRVVATSSMDVTMNWSETFDGDESMPYCGDDQIQVWFTVIDIFSIFLFPRSFHIFSHH